MRRYPEIVRARLVVSGVMANDVVALRVEVFAASEGLAERLAHTVRDVTQLRTQVELLAPGSLPNYGKVIEDARSHE